MNGLHRGRVAAHTAPAQCPAQAGVARVFGNAQTLDLADMVIAEPQIAAKVLAVVNSPFYGLRSPLGSVGQAVTFMGMNTVRSLCLQYMLDESFNLKKAVPPTKVWCNPALARLCTDLAHSPHG
jgi:HD-like signal output (HDOD) protein